MATYDDISSAMENVADKLRRPRDTSGSPTPRSPAVPARQASGANGTWDEPVQAAPAAIQAAQPQAKNPDGSAVFGSGRYYADGDVDKGMANWREDAGRRVDERTAAISTKKQANVDARAKFDASGDQFKWSPPSGSLGGSDEQRARNIALQRDQDSYWRNQRVMQDAMSTLNSDTASPQARQLALSMFIAGQKGMEGMRTDDTARRGQDNTRYGYDQQRATGQDSNTSRQMLQDTDPTKPAGAIASLQQGEYYGAQANQVGLANESAKRVQALHQQFAAEQDPGKKAALLETIRSLSPNPEKRYMHVAGGMDMNGNKLPDVVFDTVTGKPVGGAQGRTTAQIKAKLAERKIPESEWAAYLAEASDAPAAKHAQGGAVGYAQGGEIASPLADPMQQVHPMVGEYRRYSMMAQQLGATPVSFEQFGALRQAADTQGHQVAPMQENFAGGGSVGEDDYVGGYANGDPQGVSLYGGEAVRRRTDAAEAQAMGGVQNISAPAQRAPAKSYDQIDADIAAARARMNKPKNFFGFAEGGDVGAIPVGGRQVLGPGDGKSDSIPAVIDGKRPAALSTGEFVFPVEAVRHFGMDRLNKMVEAARKPQGA